MLDWRSVDSTKLEPEFRSDVDGLFSSLTYAYDVLEGYRSLERSAALYAAYLKGGPKAAPPGKSAHNYGLAVDFALRRDPPLPNLGVWDWTGTSSGWKAALAAIEAHPRLHSGVGFGDTDHVEKLNWKSYRSWAA